MTPKAHEHGLDRVRTPVASCIADMTNLVKADTWLAVLAETRCSRTGMAQGTLTEPTVVSGMVSDSICVGRLPPKGSGSPSK
jgi:hypothetical protein